MALLRLDSTPPSTGVNSPLYLILPGPGEMKDLPVARRRVLYLLHGLSDDGSAWQRYTTIETVANAYGLVVVMPSVGRSFYIDQPNGQAFFSYLVDELPRYLREVFGLAPRREDTFIAGNSMGGYGAIKAALLRPAQYAAAASFSGVLSLAIMEASVDEPRRREFSLLFGDLSALAGSEHDPALWLRQVALSPASLPRLHVSCGRQDDLYPLSLMFHQACASLGIACDYHEEDARHTWPFWDSEIRRFLALVLGPVPL